jgi:hypothetical protein
MAILHLSWAFSSRASVGKNFPAGQNTFYICLTWIIDFDVEKNITRLRKIKWRLKSRWPPNIVFGLKSTNMHIFQITFFFRLFLSFAGFFWIFFFWKSKMAVHIEMAFLSLNHPIFKKFSRINDKYKNEMYSYRRLYKNQWHVWVY